MRAVYDLLLSNAFDPRYAQKIQDAAVQVQIAAMYIYMKQGLQAKKKKVVGTVPDSNQLQPAFNIALI